MLDVLVAESAAKPGDGSYRLRSRLNQGRTILETIKIADDLIAEYEGDDIFLCFRVRRSARRRDNQKKATVGVDLARAGGHNSRCLQF